MNATRLRFRQCKLIDETARADSLARSLQCNVRVKNHIWQVKLMIALEKKILHLCENRTSLTY